MKPSTRSFHLSVAILCFGLFEGSPKAQTKSEYEEPIVVSSTVPSYPVLARQACVEGSVAILVEIDKEGRTSTTDIIYGHPLFRTNTEIAARQWRFASASDSEARRRQVLRFTFRILASKTPAKDMRPAFARPTDVEIRVYPPRITCNDCTAEDEEKLQVGVCGK